MLQGAGFLNNITYFTVLPQFAEPVSFLSPGFPTSPLSAAPRGRGLGSWPRCPPGEGSAAACRLQLGLCRAKLSTAPAPPCSGPSATFRTVVAFLSSFWDQLPAQLRSQNKAQGTGAVTSSWS